MATMTSYSFTQQVDYPEILFASIQASNIATTLVYIERDGSGPTMSVLCWFQDALSSEDQTTLNSILSAYVNSLPIETIIQRSISNAQNFGNSLLLEYAAQNVLAGITQAGQTIPVSNYLANLYNYLSAGSLYAGIQEINNLIADTSDAKAALSPFLTNDIMYTYLNKIQTYLGIPLTPNPGS
jgi:hypothetical protein